MHQRIDASAGTCTPKQECEAYLSACALPPRELTVLCGHSVLLGDTTAYAMVNDEIACLRSSESQSSRLTGWVHGAYRRTYKHAGTRRSNA
jgi:hypothetical protein